MLLRYRIKQNMSRRGNCRERQWHLWGGYPIILKNEWIPVIGYMNFSEAHHVITDYIVSITEPSDRMHTTMDYHLTNQRKGSGKTLTQ